MKMNRHKHRCRLRRDSGIPYKSDTPVKPVLRTREKKRKLLPSKHYDTLQEEPEVDDINDPTAKFTRQVLVNSGNSRYQSGSPPVPANKECCHQKVSEAGYPSIQVTPILKTFKGGDTPESVAPCSMEPDVTFNSEDDADDCYSSTSTTLSSCFSPEIFRTEKTVETLIFPSKEELLDLHLHIKNSTLLDVSHAENIHMHHPPNLSTIIDSSTILAEKKCEMHTKTLEPESKIQRNSFKTDKALKRKTPPEPTERRPILFKKKVWFKSPITTEILKAEHILSSTHTTGETSNPQEQMKMNAKTSKGDEVNSEEGALPLRVKLKKSVKTSSEKARFFDFVSENDRDVFFQMMRESCAKLKSAFLFPSTLDTQNLSVQ